MASSSPSAAQQQLDSSATPASTQDSTWRRFVYDNREDVMKLMRLQHAVAVDSSVHVIPLTPNDDLWQAQVQME